MSDAPRHKAAREGTAPQAHARKYAPAALRRLIAGTALAAIVLGGCAESITPPRADASGSTVYASRCAACHGAAGEGEPNWKSPNADGTYPAPPHDNSGHTWHHSDRVLLGIIRDGGAQYETGSFKSRMPAFGQELSDAEMRAVLAHLKGLWGPEQRAFQAEASAKERS